MKKIIFNFALAIGLLAFTTAQAQNMSRYITLTVKNGEAIKRIGIRAKKLISNFSKVKIYLKLTVFVKKSWKNDEFRVKTDFIY